MKTNNIYVLVIVLAVIFIGGYALVSASCSNKITYNPAAQVDLGIIEASKGETYTYAGKTYDTKASAVSACFATKFNF